MSVSYVMRIVFNVSGIMLDLNVDFQYSFLDYFKLVLKNQLFKLIIIRFF